MTITTRKQFDGMKKIGAIVANCLEFVKARARPGMTTKELDDIAAEFLLDQGAISAPKSTYNFPGSICISVEKEAAHGIPGDRVLEDGDLMNVDVSAHLDGYYADNGESFVLGNADQTKTHLCKVVSKALYSGISKAKAGGLISSVGREVERIAKSNRFSVIKNLGGHGVGNSLHENPEFIGSYYNRDDKRVFGNNMVVAIEPFISNGAELVQESTDGWTLFHERYYTVQKEHTVMIRDGRLPYVFTEPTISA